MNKNSIETLSHQLGYHFLDTGLLVSAITHRSKGSLHNERLEFLGDAILNFVVALLLYQRYPHAKEGELTRMRAHLVRKETLVEIARLLSLSEYLQLGISELKSGGHSRDSILADALEAIIGAIYLDGGLEACLGRIQVFYGKHFEDMDVGPFEKDPKTRLQEYLQSRHLSLPLYEIVERKGESHRPTFTVKCVIPELNQSFIGTGANKREAEQAGAKLALEAINEKKDKR